MVLKVNPRMKAIGLLLLLVTALGVFVVSNPQARTNAVLAWEQGQVTWDDFSEGFDKSPGVFEAEFAMRFDEIASRSNNLT